MSFVKTRHHPIIGIFDSGVGGLSVWREVVRLLPQASLLYVADQHHVPYGSRSLAEVHDFSVDITRFLLRQGAGLIVVACNTASAAALHPLRRQFPDVPFVGMEPAIKPAARQTRSGVVGVMATQATFQGQLFASLLNRYAARVQVCEQVCPGLVEAVEAGALDGPATESLLRDYVTPLLTAGADQLVLGCTHYPFLRPVIERLAGPKAAVIDPAPAVARQTARVWSKIEPNPAPSSPTLPPQQYTFYTSGSAKKFAATVKQLLPLLDESLVSVRPVEWQGQDIRECVAVSKELRMGD